MYATNFHAGFADELTKTAGIRDVVKRIVQGKPVPKMGFFEKRRLAKVLGVKSGDVPQTLLERQKKDRLTKGLVAGGGLTLGTLAGGSLSKEADAYLQMPRGENSSRAPAPPPTPAAMMKRRSAVMMSRPPAAAAAMVNNQPAQPPTPPKR